MKLLYFAQLVELLQVSHEDVELPAGVRNVGDLIDWLGSRGEPWITHLVAGRIQVTVNKQFAQRTTEVRNDDEIGFFPRRDA